MSRWKIREVMFDWDGTFADTEAISIALARQILSEHAAAFFGAPMHDHLDRIDMRGKDFGQIAKLFQESVNERLPEDAKIALDIEDLRINKLRPAAREALLNARLSDGIGEAVMELQESLGLGLAVVSNSPRLRIEPLLDKHGHNARIPKSRLFSAFEDTAGRLKSDPAIYLLASEALGITPAQAAAVEDSVTGMRAARAAGIGLRVGYVGLVDPEFVDDVRKALIREGAHVVIDDMKQLPGVIAAHNAKKSRARKPGL